MDAETKKELEAMGMPTDPMGRIMWLREKAKEDEQRKKELIHSLNDIEDKIEESVESNKDQIVEQVKVKLSEKKEDVVDYLIAISTELVTEVAILKCRCAILEDQNERAMKHYHKSFGKMLDDEEEKELTDG
jgi:hypothetical protein